MQGARTKTESRSKQATCMRVCTGYVRMNKCVKYTYQVPGSVLEVVFNELSHQEILEHKNTTTTTTTTSTTSMQYEQPSFTPLPSRPSSTRPSSSRPSGERPSRSGAGEHRKSRSGEQRQRASRVDEPAQRSSRPISDERSSRSSRPSRPKGDSTDHRGSERTKAADISSAKRTKALPAGAKGDRPNDDGPQSEPRPSITTRVSRQRVRTVAVAQVENRRSMSLPVDVPYEAFPQEGRRLSLKRRQSAPAGDMIPMIRSVLRVTTQFNSLKTKGIVQDLTQHKRVEFTFLEVREYPVVLGDNPSVTEGPPITIDWGHDPSTKFVLDVNSFERMRGNRRPACDLVLPRSVREQWYVR